MWAVLAAAAALIACLPGGAVAAGSPKQGPFAGQIDVGDGRQLYLRCAGRGSPTILMDAGIHDSSDTWTVTQTAYPVPSSPSVFRGVSRFTHVCIFDRPGTIRYSDPVALTTRSTPVPMPRQLPDVASDTEKLLNAAGIETPIVIVGHSMGGLFSRYFAQTHRKQVAGMVLVDAFAPDIKPLFGSTWPRYREILNFPPGAEALTSQPGWETLDVDGAIRDVRRARPLKRMPLAVMSKTEPFTVPPGFSKLITDTLIRVWPITQRRLVALEPQTPHVIATGSDHYVQWHDPDLTTSTIKLVFDRVRALSRK